MQKTVRENPAIFQKTIIRFWQDFDPADLIAIIVIVGGIFATLKGMGDSFGPLMLAVVAFYFGMKTPPPASN